MVFEGRIGEPNPVRPGHEPSKPFGELVGVAHLRRHRGDGRLDVSTEGAEVGGLGHRGPHRAAQPQRCRRNSVPGLYSGFGANALRSLCGARLARFLPAGAWARERCGKAARMRRRPRSAAGRTALPCFGSIAPKAARSSLVGKGKGSLLTARAARLLPMKRTLKITSKGQVTLRKRGRWISLGRALARENRRRACRSWPRRNQTGGFRGEVSGRS